MQSSPVPAARGRGRSLSAAAPGRRRRPILLRANRARVTSGPICPFRGHVTSRSRHAPREEGAGSRPAPACGRSAPRRGRHGGRTDAGRHGGRTPAAAAAAQPRPVHVRLIHTGGPFSPVSVVFTTTSRIPHVHGNDEQGPRVDAGVGVASNPSIRVSSYGRCYQSFASSSVAGHLHIGRRYAVTIAVGHGAAERRFTRRITLRRATLKGTVRHLSCH